MCLLAQEALWPIRQRSVNTRHVTALREKAAIIAALTAKGKAALPTSPVVVGIRRVAAHRRRLETSRGCDKELQPQPGGSGNTGATNAVAPSVEQPYL